MADASGIPRTVAIITDGNGRWAAERGLPASAGHDAGADVMRDRIKDCVRLGVRQLTTYSFSTENWSRPAEEVEGLMELFRTRIYSEVPELIEGGVRMRFVGSKDGVSDELIEAMQWGEAQTAHCDRLDLFVAFNYGARAELLHAAERYQGGGEEAFRELLYAPEMEDPDLLIRTSGEERISNFLLWQCAYSEFVFRPELWPDFGREALEASFETYAGRQRRFGGRIT